MKNLNILFLTIIFILLSSCTLNNSKGSICIFNNSENLNITEVYLKEKNQNGFTLYYSGKIEPSFSHFIEVNPGSYSIKITVSKNINNILSITSNTETGYNIYQTVSSNGNISAIFDGTGIFFE